MSYDLDKSLKSLFSYRIANESLIYIPDLSNDFFESQNLGKFPLYESKIYKDDPIIVFFPNQNFHWFEEKESKIIFHQDIISSAFYLLSGWQEIKASKDILGRFLFSDSVFQEISHAYLPYVNVYFEIIASGIEKITKTKVLPKNQNGKLIVSHDIDFIYAPAKYRLKKYLKSLQIFSFYKLAISLIFKRYPQTIFDKIISYSQRFSFQTHFFFLATDKKMARFHNADYRLSDLAIRYMFNKLKNLKIATSLHGSLGTSKVANWLKKEMSFFDNLDQRFHFLYFNSKAFVSIMEEAQVKCDYSIGFNDKIGFRRGIALPFYLFDFEKNKASTVIEMPLAIMDVSLFLSQYMNLSLEEAKQEINKIVSYTQKYNGILVINWHFDSFDEEMYPERIQLFEYILQLFSHKN